MDSINDSKGRERTKKPLKASDLITVLENMIKEHGDLYVQYYDHDCHHIRPHRYYYYNINEVEYMPDAKHWSFADGKFVKLEPFFEVL